MNAILVLSKLMKSYLNTKNNNNQSSFKCYDKFCSVIMGKFQFSRDKPQFLPLGVASCTFPHMLAMIRSTGAAHWEPGAPVPRRAIVSCHWPFTILWPSDRPKCLIGKIISYLAKCLSRRLLWLLWWDPGNHWKELKLTLFDQILKIVCKKCILQVQSLFDLCPNVCITWFCTEHCNGTMECHLRNYWLYWFMNKKLSH